MLLAIALCVLIMLVWGKFFAPPPPDQQTQKQADTEAPAPEQDRPGQDLPEQGRSESAEPVPEPELLPESPPPAELAKARDVVVATEHMVATFSTLGGRLTSLRLPEYNSKRGGDVELVVQDEDMQWPLALEFHDPQFGARTDGFIYDCTLFEPPDASLTALADALRSCSGAAHASAEERQIRQQLDDCLPRDGLDEDLRTLVIAIAGARGAAGGSERVLAYAEHLTRQKYLVFSRQLTSQLRLIKAFLFNDEIHSFDMYALVENTGAATLELGSGKASYSVSWLPGMESSERAAKYDELVGVHLVEKNYGQKAIRKQKTAQEFPESLTWIGLKRKYFFLTLEPDKGLQSASMEPLERKSEKVHITLDMKPLQIAPGEFAANHIRICAGPMLKDVLESLGSGFSQIVNFGFFDMFGKLLLAGLLWFNKYVQNYGLAIILLTIVVRVGLFPLNQKSYKSMKEMQALQPLVNELREKYKKNPQEMNKKMMALYREHKVNPMGGCLPIAFQMPIFIALFQALRYAVELRGAQFLWIKDLSEPDRLFTLTVPINFPINLLPLLVIAAMLIQQKMTPMAAGGQSEAQQKMMQFMPVIFGFLFYSMPSGLTVYFLVSTVLGLVQQYFVQKAP
jgi:YidC/Oxa1 family membrane protein insertase